MERQAQIKDRRIEQSPVLDQHGDQQATDAAVAVKERVDGLELDMGEARFDQRVQRVVAVQP